MDTLHRILMPVVTVVAVAGSFAAPASAQDTRLRPRLTEPRLWTGPLPLDAPGPIMHAPRSTPSSIWREAFLAGYLVGGLAGVELGQADTAPRQLGLWLRGWYDGVAHSSDPSALGTARSPRWPAASTGSATWGQPAPLARPTSLSGLVEGFLDGLRLVVRAP